MTNNWFQQMFDEAHRIHQKTWNYKTHEELPESVVSYVLTVSGAECITNVSLDDVNALLNDLDVINSLNTH
mgnify:FL=1|tara:strand:- start:183 stop:395 length:213 start_codon:yes stop_codon:yes gene_type:complete